jgi:hypothetical protein
MKKMLLVIPVVILLASLVLAVTAFAGCCDEPCCDCDHECSPGYWKNHTEVWFPYYTDPIERQWMMDALTAKGWQPEFQDRFVVNNILNTDTRLEPNCH